MATILLADDVDLVCKSFSRLLSRHGHKVVLAADGDEAVRLI